MDGEAWIGAHITWRVQSEDVGELDITFAGRIDRTDDIGDGLVRISGALRGGNRFVLVTHEAELRS